MSTVLWQQLGLDIVGENPGDYSGYSVSMSADGMRVAIGANRNVGNGPNSGHVRVYEYKFVNNVWKWMQMGQDIDGEAAGDYSGCSVSLITDGTRTRVAIGAFGNDGNGADSGHVRVYQYNILTSAWEKIGDDIDGEAAGDWSGYSVSMSADGTRVAIGASQNDGNGNNSGHVRVYEYKFVNNVWKWMQMGLDINSEAAIDLSGFSVSMSADGTCVAIGAIGNDDNGLESGHVRVYKYINSAWVKLGGDIDGEAAYNFSGCSVSLSADGTRVAIGAYVNDGTTGNVYDNRGHVRVYEYKIVNNVWKWMQMGLDIDGEAEYDYCGSSVSMSADGTRMAIGYDSGHVRVFKLITVPDAPTGVSAVAGNAQAVVSFTPPANNGGSAITGYTVKSSPGNRTATGSATSLTVTGLTNGTAYTFSVVATNSAGNSVGSTDSTAVTPRPVPGAPIGVSAVAGNGQATVSFTPPTNNGGSAITGYTVKSSPGKSTATGSATSLTVTGLTNGTAYTFSVVATNSAGNSLASAASTAVTPTTSLSTLDMSPKWQQLGLDINGEAWSDYSGYSVSMSADGMRVAIGANNNDGNGSNSGHVRVYEYKFVNNVWKWMQMGLDIDGEAAGDGSGHSVSMSADGTRVAIGANSNDGNGGDSGHVRVYEYINSAWVKLGGDIDGKAANDLSGCSVSLSADGTRVAIGAIGNNDNGSSSGHVRVYKYNTLTSPPSWEQMGQNINGEAAGDWSGYSVSMNQYGTRVAIGAPYNNGSGQYSGHVRVYEYIGSAWVKLGQNINGKAAGDRSGWSVSMSADGSRVAIGAPKNDGNGADSGHVRVYKYNTLTSPPSWEQMGLDINGEAAGDESGYSVSLIADGTRVAIGAPYNDGNDTSSGHVHVYNWVGGAWVKLGQDIDGEAAGDRSGHSVSMSADGTRVAIGGIHNDGNDTNSGHVRVFKLITVPDAPTGVSAVAANAQAVVSFTPPANNGGAAITSYTVICADTDGVHTATGTESPITVTGLTNDIGYNFTVVATNIVGSSLNSVPSRSVVSYSKSYTNLIPDIKPDGSPVSEEEDIQYFMHSIYVPASGHINLFVKTNSYASYDERIIGLYANGSSTNILQSKTTVIDNDKCFLTTGGLKFEDNIMNTVITGPSAKFTNLSPGRYYIVTKTEYNDYGMDGMDVGVSFEQNGSSLQVTYEQWSNTESVPTFVTAVQELSTLGAITNISTYQQAVAALNITDGSTIDFQSLGVNYSELPVEEQNIISKKLIKSIFEVKTELNNFKVEKSSFPITSSNAKDNILIFKAHESIAITNQLNPTTSIYVGIENVGESNTFTKGSNTYTIDKTASGYNFTSNNITTYHLHGDQKTIDDLIFVFGGVSVSSTHQPVEVNLNIAVDASGTINIFGQTLPTVDNVIVAQTKLPAAALYSAENSMFEFWEPSDATGTRKAALAGDYAIGETVDALNTRDWKLLTRKLANGIQGCLEGVFDASAASPFNEAGKYAAVHKSVLNFGDLALRCYAHYTLGHVDATAAITNDQAFIEAMLAREASRGVEGVSDTFSDAAAGTKANANLANLLVKAIASKDRTQILAIANQVLGQDASRAMDEDNNEITDSKRQALKFIAGDIIYMNIKLQKPDIVIAPTGQKVSDSVLEGKFAGLNKIEENYTLKITLS